MFDFFKEKDSSKSTPISKSSQTVKRKWEYILPEGPHCKSTDFAELAIKTQSTLIVGQGNTDRLVDSIIQAIVSMYRPGDIDLLLLDTRWDLFKYSKFPHVNSYKLINDSSTEEITKLYQYIDDRLRYMFDHSIRTWVGKPLFVIINNYTDFFYYQDKQIEHNMFGLLSRARIAGMHFIAVTNGVSDYHRISPVVLSPFTVRAVTFISDYESRRLFDTDKFGAGKIPVGKYAVRGEMEMVDEMKIYDIPNPSDDLEWLLNYWTGEGCKHYDSDLEC